MSDNLNNARCPTVAYAKYMEAVARVRRAEESADAAMREVFPIGSRVSFMVRGYGQMGVVVGHGYDHKRLKVNNDHTGKSRWVNVYSFDVRPLGVPSRLKRIKD